MFCIRQYICLFPLYVFSLDMNLKGEKTAMDSSPTERNKQREECGDANLSATLRELIARALFTFGHLLNIQIILMKLWVEI